MTTREPEWDARAVDEVLASVELEGRLCHGCASDLGLSMDPELAAHGVHVDADGICFVCQAKEAYERRLRDDHEGDPSWWDGRSVVASLVQTSREEAS